MQTQTTNLETNRATFRPRKLPPFLQLTEARARCRKTRISFSPRREVCLTKRAMIAAIREAEFADWMASGGDYLASTHQPID